MGAAIEHGGTDPRIVIIGGGYAGAVAAIKLLDSAAIALSLTTVERREELGRGVAYSTRELVHLLNGTAQTSTLHPDDPHHLARWLAANGERFGWTPPADILQASQPRSRASRDITSKTVVGRPV